MTDRDRDILEELTRVNPVREGDLSDPATAQQGEELFARIQAGREQPNRGATRRLLRYRLALAGVGLAVVAAAIIVPLVALNGGNDLRVTAGHEPSTGSTTAATQVVRRDAALRGIIELAMELGLFHTSGESPDTRLTSLATAVGAILPDEGPDYQLAGVVSRSQYALWLWRVFGSHLPARQTSIEFKDQASLTAMEQEAVRGLAAAGILEPDGYFRGSDNVTPQEEEVLTHQIRRVVQTRQ